eukprot:TRINITY_DN6066_c0_g1_i2.p1 TRINITY_DN6066_c0_g1~~TRINITY_DN6066_c0_g1_i2.p1  ORF type:complete len:251 (+),score=25.33 TRINITY_DN6066_c0_g1_i2:33-785(+)
MTSQSSSDVIELNVGGTIFASCRSTLTRISDSMLARLIDGNIPTAKDSQGRYFIDRDPTHFGTLLNYLRTGELYVPEDVPIKRVVQEADFYGISLKKVISEKKKRDKLRNSAQTEPQKLAETLRNTTMDTWKQFAVSKFEALVPVIMEKLQAQTKTHPFFEAELALSIDTAGRETDDPQNIAVVARHSDSTFLVHVPLKFVGQPICESTYPSDYNASSSLEVVFLALFISVPTTGSEPVVCWAILRSRFV